MPKTYEPIATQTLGSAVASVTFSSISGSYTDLILVAQPGDSNSSGNVVWLRFNADTGNNYSSLELSGNGSTVESIRQTNNSNIALTARIGTPDQALGKFVIISNIMNYANTTTYKTALSRGNANDTTFPGTSAIIGTWRNTAAITSITILQNSGNFFTGSTFTLYGIKAA